MTQLNPILRQLYIAKGNLILKGWVQGEFECPKGICLSVAFGYGEAPDDNFNEIQDAREFFLHRNYSGPLRIGEGRAHVAYYTSNAMTIPLWNDTPGFTEEYIHECLDNAIAAAKELPSK